MCSSNSGRNLATIEPTGIAIESPSTHRQCPMMFSCTEAMTSRSIGVAFAANQPLEHLRRPVGPLATRRALAARLVVIEARRAGQLGDRDRVVGDDDRPRAEHRARSGKVLERIQEVELGLGEHRRRGAAGKPGLHPPTVPGPPARSKMISRRDPELDLVVAGRWTQPETETTLVPGDCSDRALEPGGAVVDDVGDVGASRVVDQGRAVVEAWIAGNGGFRRGLPRLPSSASSSAVSSPRCAPAPRWTASSTRIPVPGCRSQMARLIGLGDGAVEDVGDLPVLAADEDEGVRGADRERRSIAQPRSADGGSWPSLAILERSRFGLVRVATRYFSISPRGGNEPFLPIEKPAPPRPPARTPRSRRSGPRGRARERSARSPVAAVLAIAVDRRQSGRIDIAERECRSQAWLPPLEAPRSAPETRGSGSNSGTRLRAGR